MVLAMVAGLAALGEAAQSWVGRTPDGNDFAFGVPGAGAGWAAVQGLRRPWAWPRAAEYGLAILVLAAWPMAQRLRVRAKHTPRSVPARWLLRPRSPEEMAAQAARLHHVPPVWLNGLLTAAFCAETPLGVYLPLPWGTSALAVVRSR